MSGNKPRRIRSDLASKGELVEVNERLFRQKSASYGREFATIFVTPIALKIIHSLSKRDIAVMHALLALWDYKNRCVTTSITQISEKLKSSNIKIGMQHISTAISNLERQQAIYKIRSGHNQLVVKFNPYLCWKGLAKDNFNACRQESEMWDVVDTLTYSHP